MTALALAVAAYAVAVLLMPSLRSAFVRDRAATVPLALYGHLAAGAIALAVGPFQFSVKLRSRRIGVHRWLGRIYIISNIVGGVSGLVLAAVSLGGVPAHLGFAVLSLLWVFTGVRAYQRIRRGDQADHRRWVIRNYSLTFAAVTLRIYLPAALALGIPFEHAYPAIAWLCWLPNLVVAEWWFLRHRNTPSRLPAAA